MFRRLLVLLIYATEKQTVFNTSHRIHHSREVQRNLISSCYEHQCDLGLVRQLFSVCGLHASDEGKKLVDTKKGSVWRFSSVNMTSRSFDYS